MRFLLPALLGGLTTLAIPAAAMASSPPAAPVICSDTATSKPFAAFGDLADYSLAPGGDFETDAHGWTLFNAAVVDGNESLGIAGGSHALLLGASARGGDAVAVSPEFCVTQAHPTFRYVVRGGSSRARVDLTTTVSYREANDPTKIKLEEQKSGLSYGALWAPSAKNPLATLLKWDKVSGGQLVRISFRVPAKALAGGGLSIDSVMVDPYRRS